MQILIRFIFFLTLCFTYSSVKSFSNEAFNWELECAKYILPHKRCLNQFEYEEVDVVFSTRAKYQANARVYQRYVRSNSMGRALYSQLITFSVIENSSSVESRPEELVKQIILDFAKAVADGKVKVKNDDSILEFTDEFTLAAAKLNKLIATGMPIEEDIQRFYDQLLDVHSGVVPAIVINKIVEGEEYPTLSVYALENQYDGLKRVSKISTHSPDESLSLLNLSIEQAAQLSSFIANGTGAEHLPTRFECTFDSSTASTCNIKVEGT